MNINITESADTEKEVTITVVGEIDVYTAPKLRRQLMPLCENNKNLNIDLSGVEYIDSTGLGVLIGAYKAQKLQENRLTLTGVNARVMRLFRITGLHEIMDIQEDGKS